MQSAAPFDSLQSDDISDLSECSGGHAPVGTIESPVETSSGCTNCGWEAYSSGTYCKRCGYYAVLGRCIELEDWERETGNDGDLESESNKPIAIPIWAWQIAGALIGVTAISVVGRYLTAADSTQRLTWSLSEYGAGMATILLAHVLITRVAILQNASLQLGDAITSPLRIWMEACVDFQRSSRWVVLGIAGLWAVLLTHVLLGVPYGRMFTHEEAPPMKEASGDDAGSSKPSGKGRKSGADKIAKDGTTIEPDDSKDSPKIRTLDCLIIGYQPGTEQTSSVSSIVVAAQVDGQWTVVGTISDGLTAEVQQELIGKAASLHRAQPFVATNYQAIWLEPVLNCQIEATSVSGDSQPPMLTFKNLK